MPHLCWDGGGGGCFGCATLSLVARNFDGQIKLDLAQPARQVTVYLGGPQPARGRDGGRTRGGAGGVAA
jgi:hypothetical protein